MENDNPIVNAEGGQNPTQAPAGAGGEANPPNNPQENGGSGTATDPAQTPTPTTFTQEQLNQIIQERLARADQAFYDRYGVKDQTELDSLVGEAQAYETTLAENAQLKERLAFLTNGILPEKEDDVRTYFKGKGIAMSEEALKQVLQTHPEWVKQATPPANNTTIVPVGAQPQQPPKEDEEQKYAKMFGFDHFVPPIN